MSDVRTGHNTTEGTRNAESRSIRMKPWGCVFLLFLWLASGVGLALEPVPTAMFPFGFVNTSPGATRPDEQVRLTALNSQLRDALVQSGCCAPVDLSAVAKQAESFDMVSCNGCEVDLARQAGAAISVTGWVQKVSDLILNINVVARRTSTGAPVAAGSVDIRGNTDESWSRGLTYLVRNRLHPSDW